MIKKTMTYTDYNGVSRTEDFYFNLTKAEVMEMEMSTKGGLAETINRIISTQDQPALIKIFKDLIVRAYGVKSPDGKRFIKNDEVIDEFVQTEAFSDLFIELATNADSAAEFVNGIVPAGMAEQLGTQAKK